MLQRIMLSQEPGQGLEAGVSEEDRGLPPVNDLTGL